MELPDTITDAHTYHITRLIAHGGMGSVYEAQQEGVAGFSKRVALKVIRHDLAADPEFVRLFIGEAKLVADLVHENIVQVYDLGRSTGRYHIVMEYVDGIDLERFIRHHARAGLELPAELGAFIASRVCRGLDYAHTKRGHSGEELGIVHRDVSPKNVLLNFEGVVKITDFGIAKARLVMEQNEDLLMGKVQYMSPEQAAGEATDRRSDIFSLGLVLYELLVGRLPEGEGGPGPRRLVSAPDPTDARPDLPAALSAIVRRSLEPDLEQRFQSAGAMGYALEHFMYHDHYGPTNLTLREYLQTHFAEAVAPVLGSVTEKAHVVEQRAETLFGPRVRPLPVDNGNDEER